MTALLERLTAWLERRMGLFELMGPIVLPDQDSWLRIDPDRQHRWFNSEIEALSA